MYVHVRKIIDRINTYRGNMQIYGVLKKPKRYWVRWIFDFFFFMISSFTSNLICSGYWSENNVTKFPNVIKWAVSKLQFSSRFWQPIKVSSVSGLRQVSDLHHGEFILPVFCHWCCYWIKPSLIVNFQTLIQEGASDSYLSFDLGQFVLNSL